MDAAPLSLSLTPHGRLVPTHDADAPPIDSGLRERTLQAFARGSGHGLLLLGADEAGTALPPVEAYWREFGARYVTALCTQQDSDAPRKSVAAPPGDELERMALAAPPMMGAEYLTAAVLEALWQELDAAFGIELSEAKCGVQERAGRVVARRLESEERAIREMGKPGQRVPIGRMARPPGPGEPRPGPSLAHHGIGRDVGVVVIIDERVPQHRPIKTQRHQRQRQSHGRGAARRLRLRQRLTDRPRDRPPLAFRIG